MAHLKVGYLIWGGYRMRSYVISKTNDDHFDKNEKYDIVGILDNFNVNVKDKNDKTVVVSLEDPDFVFIFNADD